MISHSPTAGHMPLLQTIVFDMTYLKSSLVLPLTWLGAVKFLPVSEIMYGIKTGSDVESLGSLSF